MKKIFSLALSILALVVPAFAQDSDSNSTSVPIAMDTHSI